MTDPIEILPTSEAPSRERAVERALEHLAAGRAVAVPTEGPYGLLVPDDLEGAHPEFANELRELGFQPIECARAEPSAILAAIDRPTPAARRLIERYLPGPLQLRIDSRGRQILARVPADDTTREILRRAPSSVRLLEIGGTTLPIAFALDPDSLVRTLTANRSTAAQLAAVVDAGRARIAQPAAAVAATLTEFTILRAGILSAADLERTALRRVLFVCSGNTCRSPMAAALLKLALEKRLEIPSDRLAAAGFVVESAGAFATQGSPASEGAHHAMALREVDMASHRSRWLEPALFARQDYVFAMTRSILAHLLRNMPPGPRVVEHIDPRMHDVADPFGGDAREYVECALEIESRIEAIAERLVSESSVRPSH